MTKLLAIALLCAGSVYGQASISAIGQSPDANPRDQIFSDNDAWLNGYEAGHTKSYYENSDPPRESGVTRPTSEVCVTYPSAKNRCWVIQAGIASSKTIVYQLDAAHLVQVLQDYSQAPLIGHPQIGWRHRKHRRKR